MPDSLVPNIVTNVTAPQSMTVDGTTARQQSISDQIKADQYQAAAARTRGLPMRRVIARPPSNADINCTGGNY
jgi:hypothetical protein